MRLYHHDQHFFRDLRGDGIIPFCMRRVIRLGHIHRRGRVLFQAPILRQDLIEIAMQGVMLVKKGNSSRFISNHTSR